MAIKKAAVKRTSTSAGSGIAKKQKTVQKQCDTVRDAVLGAESFPEQVLKMVANNLEKCLGVPKEDRHGYQEKVNGMVGDVLTSVEANIQKSIEAAESKCSSASTEKDSREQALAAAVEDVAAKAAALEAAKGASAESSTGTKAAKVAVSQAETAQETGDSDLEAASGRKVKLDEALVSSYEPLKEGSVAGPVAQTCIATLTKLGKEFPFDASMLASLPSALSKSPGERGGFDGMVLQQLEDELKKQIASLQEILANGEVAKAARAAKMEETKAALESARTHEASCKNNSEQCQTELAEAKAAHREAAKAVAQFGSDMKLVEKDLSAAKADLIAFNEGASGAYKELLEYTAIEPPALELESGAAAAATTQ